MMDGLPKAAERGGVAAADHSAAGERAAERAAAARAEKKHGRRRRLGTALMVIGVVAMLYAGVIILWGDPATGLYARWRQHQLSGQIDHLFSDYQAALPAAGGGDGLDGRRLAAYEHRIVASRARDFSRTVKLGQPLGRLVIPRIGLSAVFLQGTRWGPDLSKGPGHYPETVLPGLGRTVAIAGHRTTFGAWFRHIDSLEAGDSIVVRLPYATFYYRVFGHRIVASDDWSIIRNRGFDALVLSACHPLYSASHRWIVFAALYRVKPSEGSPYLVDLHDRARPVGADG